MRVYLNTCVYQKRPSIDLVFEKKNKKDKFFNFLVQLSFLGENKIKRTIKRNENKLNDDNFI